MSRSQASSSQEFFVRELARDARGGLQVAVVERPARDQHRRVVAHAPRAQGDRFVPGAGEHRRGRILAQPARDGEHAVALGGIDRSGANGIPADERTGLRDVHDDTGPQRVTAVAVHDAARAEPPAQPVDVDLDHVPRAGEVALGIQQLADGFERHRMPVNGDRHDDLAFALPERHDGTAPANLSRRNVHHELERFFNRARLHDASINDRARREPLGETRIFSRPALVTAKRRVSRRESHRAQ